MGGKPSKDSAKPNESRQAGPVKFYNYLPSDVRKSEVDFHLRPVKIQVYVDLVQHGLEVVDKDGKIVAKAQCDPTWSTNEVCLKLLSLATETPSALGANLLVDRSVISNKEHVGVFVSQARKCNFTNMIMALAGALSPETYVWLDVLQVNEHTFAKAPVDSRTDWMGSSLHKAIASFERRIIYFDLWDEPAVLTRAWCAWEFLGCVFHKKTTQILLSHTEEERFVKEALLGNVKSIFDRLSALDVAKSKCRNEDDLDYIFERIKSDVGFVQVNELVLGRLREWFIETGKVKVKSMSGDNAARLSANIGLLLLDFGRFEEALGFIERAEPRLKALGAKSVEFGTLRNNKAMCLMNLDKVKDALEPAQDAVAIFKAIDKDNALVGVALTSVGAVLLKQNDFAGAQKNFEAAYEVFKHAGDPSNAATTLSNLGEALIECGEVEKATTTLEKALLELKKSNGESHIWLAPVLCNYALALQKSGKAQEALVPLEQALAIQERVLGSHLNVAVTLSTIAKCHGAVKEFAKEGEYLKRALKVAQTATLKQDSVDVAYHMSDLANWYDLHGKKQEAIQVARDSLGMMERTLGKSDPTTQAMKAAWKL